MECTHFIHNAAVVKLLVHMAFDVYNDCLYETLSAYSWPARSLTTMAANRLIAVMHDEGSDANVSTFTPAAQDLHYRMYVCTEIRCTIARCLIYCTLLS